MYWLLAGVFALCVLGSWASFTDRVRQSGGYMPLMVLVSVCTGVLFASGCRLLDNKERIFLFSLLYDVAMAAAYYVVPVLFFGTRPSPQLAVASVLIVLGVLILHTGHK